MDNLDDKKRNEIQALIAAEVFEKPPAKNDVVTESNSENIVNKIHDAAVVGIVKTDEGIQKKFTDQAKKTVEGELNVIDQKTKKRQQEASYDANAEACNNYGIDKDVPLWQIKLMKLGSAFWFIVYWLFASVTIAPLNIFFKGLKAFIKSGWLVFILALICYLLIVVGIPLLIKFFG